MNGESTNNRRCLIQPSSRANNATVTGAEPSPPSKPWLQLVALLVLFSQYHMQYTYTHRYHALQFISDEDFVHSSTDKFEECAVVEGYVEIKAESCKCLVRSGACNLRGHDK